MYKVKIFLLLSFWLQLSNRTNLTLNTLIKEKKTLEKKERKKAGNKKT